MGCGKATGIYCGAGNSVGFYLDTGLRNVPSWADLDMGDSQWKNLKWVEIITNG